ncbi:DUF2957 domain-containing protein [Paraburkholderia sp. GAS42]|jgi:hypothetical protein|uniref:DUF2957 domain-containing protein n=1 Tax=Paraburkholderia sp. GAS42 TaxID=3035135 RepID=UPI003D1E12DE
MSHAIYKGVALAMITAPLLAACGGGKADDPGAINSAQCAGASCGVQGPPTQGAGPAPLCPADADIVKSTYLGGAGSGEVVQLNIDATAMTYSLKFLESPVPTSAGQVTTTRKGVQLNGSVMHPPAGALPTAEQTRCAFILVPTGGTASDGSTYSTASTFNKANPPMILVGQGVAGGGIPGASIQYGGIDPLNLNPLFAALGLPITLPSGPSLFPVPGRNFDFYPFLAFANVDTNLADLKGDYNALLYHLRPSNNYTTIATTGQESFDGAGHCSVPSGSSNPACVSTGGQWAANPNGSYFTSADAPQLLPAPTIAGVFTFPRSASANMILGKVNGQVIPLVVRTGVVSLNLPPALDDESGIGMLAPATQIQSGGIDGGYVGADSNFKYTATLLQGQVGAFINPSTQASEGGVGISYTQHHPGLLTVQDASGNGGNMIGAGGLYAVFVNGAENGGVTKSSANVNSTTGTDNSSVPYFGIGAQISK